MVEINNHSTGVLLPCSGSYVAGSAELVNGRCSTRGREANWTPGSEAHDFAGVPPVGPDERQQS